MTARWEIVLVVVRLALIATVTPGRVRPSTMTTLFSVTPPLGTRTSAATTGVAVGFTGPDRRPGCAARGVGVAVTRALVNVNAPGAVVAVAMGPAGAVVVGVVETVGVDDAVAVFVGVAVLVFVGVAVLVFVGVAVLVFVGVAVLVFVFAGAAVLVVVGAAVLVVVGAAVLVGIGDGGALSVGTGVAVAGFTMTTGTAVAVLVAVGTAPPPGVLLGDGVALGSGGAFGGDVAVAASAPPDPVQSAARLARLGEPQPVTSSHPVPAGWPLLPLVTSWKSRASVVALLAN